LNQEIGDDNAEQV